MHAFLNERRPLATELYVIGCEYRPKAGTSAGLGWLRQYRALPASKKAHT